jgi:hypothetical protein
MEWQEIRSNWVLIPPQPIGIIHFLGGAFVATAPHLTYRWLLEKLAKQGYLVIATPFLSTLDHKAIAVNALNRLENVLSKLEQVDKIDTHYFPIYGIGHSLGCKLHLLIGSLFQVERAGNILISFNNYPLKQAIPFFEQIIPPLANNLKTNWQIDPELQFEFTPSPTETETIIQEHYLIRRNLLVKFSNDTIDQTASLKPILTNLFPGMVSQTNLPGNHLTPLGQDLDWQVGEVFTPIDAVGQWFKQNLARDLHQLYREISLWLNPTQSLNPPNSQE